MSQCERDDKGSRDIGGEAEIESEIRERERRREGGREVRER